MSDRRNQLAKITRRLQRDIFESLTLAGIKEEEIVKFTHKFTSDLEALNIIDFIETLRPDCVSLIKLYKMHPEVTWKLLTNDFEEVKMLNSIKAKIKRQWKERPRFRV